VHFTWDQLKVYMLHILCTSYAQGRSQKISLRGPSCSIDMIIIIHKSIINRKQLILIYHHILKC